MNYDNYRPIFKLSKEISYIKLLKIMLSKWHWMIGIFIIGLIACYLYLYFTLPLYLATASLKFEEKRSEISELMNIRNIYDRTDKVESEKMVIRSRNVLIKAINSLHCEVSFYTKKGFQKTDIYPYKPVKVTVLEKGQTDILYNTFKFQATGQNKYKLSYKYNNKQVSRTYKYGQIIALPHLRFIISTSENNIQDSTVYIIRFNNQVELLERINRSLKLDDAQNINILNLRFTDHNPYFARDILNAILNEYLHFDKMQRSISASQTSNFINTLLETISKVVKISGQAIQKFKENHNMLSISSSTAGVTNRLTDLATEKHTLDIQNVLIRFAEKDLMIDKHGDKLNYDLQGITDFQLNTLLSKYNELLINKSAASNTYTQNSKTIIHLDEQIADFKTAIISNISAQGKSNAKRRIFLNQQIDSILQAQAEIPKAEKDFITLQSKFDIEQKIYAYLEEKKLEAQISKAAVIPGATVIDKAEYPIQPLSPVPKNAYTTFILASLTLGMGLIFTVRVLNPYIHNKEAIEELSTIPIIGIVRRYKGLKSDAELQILTIKNSRSSFSESVRSVRSNLNFMASEKHSKIICITSEISGEGKSFISLNLACTLTLIEKKVLLIAADLRKSKLHQELNTSNQNGLSKYLSGQSALEEILIKTRIENLDFISSGPIPPNPSELLHTHKLQNMLNSLKDKYDFIILDSAPIGLVSDGKPLIKMADINLFILRSGVSRCDFATTPERLKKEFNLSNIAIILNDFEDNSFQRSYSSGRKRGGDHHTDYYYSSQINYAHHKDYFEL